MNSDQDLQKVMTRTDDSSNSGQILVLRRIAMTISAMVTILIIIMLALTLDWLPWVANIDNSIRLLGISWILIVLTALGVIWLVIVLFSLRHRRVRNWTLWAAPLVAIIGAGLIIGVNRFVPSDFDSSREELDMVASEVSRHPLGWKEGYSFESPRTIGQIEAISVERRADGVVLVGDADGSAFLEIRGWAYSVNGPPDFAPGVNVKPLHGAWYSYSYK